LQTSAAAASITRLHIHLRLRSPGRPGLAQSFTLSLRSTLPPPLLSSNSLELSINGVVELQRCFCDLNREECLVVWVQQSSCCNWFNKE
jgi:hypothetical protein